VLPSEGFTLIELMVVLFIMAIVSAISAPSVGRGMEGLRVRSEVQGIVAFLRHGRQQAITKVHSYTVTFNSVAHAFSLTEEDSDTVQSSRPVSSSIRIVADQLSIVFSPQGFSTGGSLLLEGAGGRSYRITVHPLTGRVTSTRVG